MDFTGSPLVLTKIHIPAARSRLIHRTSLVDLLIRDDHTGFVLICAPAGYGKTTLMVEWTQILIKDHIEVAWYSLDPGDDDPIPFRSYLVASFIQALGPIPELTQIAQLLRSSPEMELQRILPAVINAVLSTKQQCVLVLDDYHQISSPVIHNALAYLVEHLPENLRIAISSRSDPPLPLARLRARGQLLEIRTASLRFNSQETAQFLHNVMGLDLSSQNVAELEERTEGWVTGLQLAALSFSSRTDKDHVIASFTGSNRYLVEYLMEEVISQQSEEVQSFLLATSLLDHLCSPLCDAILSGVDKCQVLNSEEILKRLDQANLFLIPLDDQGYCYRYHHLFQDFLQTRLTKSHPEIVSLLHRLACDWLATNGFLREAAVHAFQASDWEYAAAFVEQHSFSLIVHSDISTIYEWCTAFPEEVMQRHPMLCILQALALAYGFRRQNRAKVEVRLQQADQAITLIEDSQTVRSLYDLAAVVRTFLAMAPDLSADPREVLTLASSMLSAYPEEDTGRFSGLLLTGYAYLALLDTIAAEHAFETARQIALHESLYFGIVESTFHLARLAISQGMIHRAAELCRQGRADIAAVLAHPERDLPAVGSLDILLGCVLLEWDQLDEAEHCLSRGLEWMGGGMNPYYLMTAYLALSRLCEIQGRADEAMKFLDRLEDILPDLAFCTHGLRIRHSLRIEPNDASAMSAARIWCHEFSSSLAENANPPGLGPLGAAEAYYLASLTWAELQIPLGNPRSALEYLQTLIDSASAHGLIGRSIELRVLQALGWRMEGDHALAMGAIEQALSAGQPEGYLRTFDQGQALNQILVETAQHGVCKEYIDKILAAIHQTKSLNQVQAGAFERPVHGPYGENLSERELEVLRFIANGSTNQEIASRLVISVGTVKSHVNHILGKLDAHNRTEAVARARELGLLEI